MKVPRNENPEIGWGSWGPPRPHVGPGQRPGGGPGGEASISSFQAGINSLLLPICYFAFINDCSK